MVLFFNLVDFIGRYIFLDDEFDDIDDIFPA